MADTNFAFIRPHSFIIKINEMVLVLLCYDNFNLYLYDKNIIVNVPVLKELIAEIMNIS